MQIFDRSLSRFSLQRWVAVITGSGTLVVAVVNLFGRALLYSLPLAEAWRDAFVVPIFALAILFLLSGVSDSTFWRAFQVTVFAAAGLYLAIFASGEYMSSAVFVIFSFVLYYEFKTEGLPRFWLVIAGVTYALAIVYSIVRSARIAAEDMSVSASVVGLAFTNIAVFTGSVVFLFALVIYRQHLIRKRHSDELERRVAERTVELQDALNQRDTMLQEIHHRVGNSLQLLASFVSLQQENVQERERQILKETELRVHAIADVHATLYSQHQLSHLPLGQYAGDLISDLQVAYRGDALIVAEIDTEMEGHIDFAISFGIILNELITNAAKHGASFEETASISVRLVDGPDALFLTVRDSGPGFDAEFRAGIGTEVVDQLVRQNAGEISRVSEEGARVSVSFPESSVVRHEPVRSSREQSA